MDSIADMGGVLGYGPATAPTPGEPPFAEPWEGRAFALTAALEDAPDGVVDEAALLARATALRAVDDHEDHHP
jgi:hypothetical protein